MIARREFIGRAAAALVAGLSPELVSGANMEELYGLVGQLRAVPGARAELVEILLAASEAMEGNLLYLIAEDLDDPESIWITEVWRTKTDHGNSLKPVAVQAAIARARPLIADFGVRAQTRPVNHAG